MKESNNAFSIWDEPAENQIWHGEPTQSSICTSCVNRFDDGHCDIYDVREQSAIIGNNRCEDFIEKQSK